MGLRDADGGYRVGDEQADLIMAISRVALIKAAIVFVAAVGTAVIIFVTSYRIFGFDLVSRGRSLDYFTVGWIDVLWLILPNLIVALFVRRWWIRQADRQNEEANRPSALFWIAGYLVTTLAMLLYYFLTFTALLKP